MLEHPDRHLPAAEEHIVEVLVEEHVQVSCDIVPIDGHTWAIHGSIAVDGEVVGKTIGLPSSVIFRER